MALRETVGRTEKLNTTTNERSAEAAGLNFGIGGRIYRLSPESAFFHAHHQVEGLLSFHFGGK